jgi:phosphomannomutase
MYGGEGNGGPIDPRVGYVRDSFVGMAQCLDLLRVTGKSLGQLADELPQLAICKTKATVPPETLPAVFAAIAEQMPDAASDRQDGLRLQWADRWLLVRGSNTEPIVRLIAEAPQMSEAEALCAQAAEIVKATLNR